MADDLSPSEEGCNQAINAALKYITEGCQVPRNRVILFGRSIGTGPTVDLAARTPGLLGVVRGGWLFVCFFGTNAIRFVWITEEALLEQSYLYPFLEPFLTWCYPIHLEKAVLVSQYLPKKDGSRRDFNIHLISKPL